MLEAPLKAAEVDGGLYAAFGAVEIDTLVGAASQVGDRTTWTFRELQETFAGMPDGATLFQFNTSRDQIAAQLMMCTLENYVDREAGERSMKGLQMLDNFTLVALADLPALNAKWGGQCAFVGYPTEDGSVGGSFVCRGPCLAMSSTCQNKEAVWDFFRMLYLNPNPTISSTDDTVPVCKLLYDKQKESLVREPRWVYPFPIAQPDAVLAPPLTEEEVQWFEDFFSSISRIDILEDATLCRLVLEVCAPCFSGNKTLDETVSLLDNRVGLYLSEQK